MPTTNRRGLASVARRLDLAADTGRPPLHPRPRPEDYTDLVLREVASTGWKVRARIAVAAPADRVVARINPAVGVVETVDDHNSILVTGADSLATVAAYVGMLEMDFRVTQPRSSSTTCAGSASATCEPPRTVRELSRRSPFLCAVSGPSVAAAVT